ncbi:hypothetical protein ACRAWD_21835 [Caulobacter segnis]
MIKDADDQIGVITVHDGPGLPAGEIIAPLVGADPEATRRPITTASRTPRRSRRPQAARAGSCRCWSRDLLHQSPVRDGRVDRQDRGRGWPGRGGGVLYRRDRRRYLGRGLVATANWSPTASAASGATRCCPASTRSIPMPAA